MPITVLVTNDFEHMSEVAADIVKENISTHGPLTGSEIRKFLNSDNLLLSQT
jgi:hypothetical protein